MDKIEITASVDDSDSNLSSLEQLNLPVSKMIHSAQDLDKFKQSPAYNDIISFITSINKVHLDPSIDESTIPTSESITQAFTILIVAPRSTQCSVGDC